MIQSISNPFCNIPKGFEGGLVKGGVALGICFVIMAVGMILAATWQELNGIHAPSLLTSPLILQWMMIYGFIGMLAATVFTIWVVPIYYGARKVWSMIH